MYLITVVPERWRYSTKKMWRFTQKTGVQGKELNNRTLLYKMKQKIRKDNRKSKGREGFSYLFHIVFSSLHNIYYRKL